MTITEIILSWNTEDCIAGLIVKCQAIVLGVGSRSLVLDANI